jgi:archaemetzincin
VVSARLDGSIEGRDARHCKYREPHTTARSVAGESLIVESKNSSPRIKHVSWGRLEVEGKPEPYKDAKLFPGGSREWNWRETGTGHTPGIQIADVQELLDHSAKVVVLSRGMAECLQVLRETLDFLKQRQIAVHVLPTKQAVALYNKLAETEPGWRTFPHDVLIRCAAIVCLALFSMAFQPPDQEVKRAAVGDLTGLSPVLRHAFSADASEFEPIPKPGPHDWLAVHPEQGQTFDEFTASPPNRPSGSRRIIYLQPLGEFVPDRSPPIEKLREFASGFFAIEVKALPAVSLDKSKFTTRRNPNTGNVQVLTGGVLHFLKSRLPADAFCELAITMEDLYPEPSWNFVFGQASLRERVGVYSFARYDPAFYGEARGHDYETVLLRRSCKVLAHETGHMFGLAHCTFFNCLMNGSNHRPKAIAVRCICAPSVCASCNGTSVST